MCQDFQDVLHGAAPRPYGGGGAAVPSNYECLAPSPLYDKLLKLRKPLGC
jgi:hypothetical protein